MARNEFWIPRRLFSLIILTAISLAAFAQSVPAKKASDQLPPGATKRLSIKELEQFAVYWTDEAGWHTELQLRNNMLGRLLTVTPVLRSHEGEEVSLPQVTIRSGDVVSVDLHDLLPNVAPQMAGNYGSVVFHYTAPVIRALYASVMVHDAGNPISFHLDAYGRSEEYQVGGREGIWWLPNETAGDYLILTNMGNQPLNAVLELFPPDGKPYREPVRLGARQTNRISIRAMAKKAGFSEQFGGIRIKAGQGAGNLDSAHVIFDEIAGFSAMMKMFDHDPNTTPLAHAWGHVKEWTTRAPMLALTNPDSALAFPDGTRLQPKIFVRNASNKSFQAKLIFHWRSADTQGLSDPVNITLKPDETRIVDVTSLQAANVIPSAANWSSVTISGPVKPEDFLAVAASYDQTLRYGAQTPFTDQLASHWEGGQWQVDGTHNSLMAIGNGGDKTV